jgi:tRNA(Arg) A34 adenosine deaminase TadA
MHLTISLPDWLAPDPAPQFGSDDEAMRWALQLAQRNIADGGGPFAALVMDDSGCLIAAGCNRVVPANNSVLHAEMVALMLAQQVLRSHDLACAGRFTLVTTCAPCAMCLGALPWSGIVRVVCGARGEDAEAIGFDEGHKPADWTAGLRRRGIAVVEDVQREAAAAVLRHYGAENRTLY